MPLSDYATPGNLALVTAVVGGGGGFVTWFFKFRRDNDADEITLLERLEKQSLDSLKNFQEARRAFESEIAALRTELLAANTTAGQAVRAQANAEKTHRSTLSALKRILNVIGLPAFVDDAQQDGFCLWVNGAWEQMTGMEAEKALGQGWLAALGGTEAYQTSKAREWQSRIADRLDSTPYELIYRHVVTGIEFNAVAVYTIVDDIDKPVLIIGVVLRQEAVAPTRPPPPPPTP